MSPITLGAKRAGERSARNPHATFDVAGAGDGLTVTLMRHSHGKPGGTDRRHLRSTAPAPDPTDEAGVGNGLTVELVRHSQRKQGVTDRLHLRRTAPAPDPTTYRKCPFGLAICSLPFPPRLMA